MKGGAKIINKNNRFGSTFSKGGKGGFNSYLQILP